MGQIKRAITSDWRPFVCDPIVEVVTGTLAETTVKSYPLPARPCGIAGSIRVRAFYYLEALADTITLKIKAGGTTLYTETVPAVYEDYLGIDLIIAFAGSYAAQRTLSVGALVNTGARLASSAVDFSVPALLDFTLQLADASDAATFTNAVIIINEYP